MFILLTACSLIAVGQFNFHFQLGDKNSGEDKKGILLYYYVSVYLGLMSTETCRKARNYHKSLKEICLVLFVKYFQFKKSLFLTIRKLGKRETVKFYILR